MLFVDFFVYKYFEFRNTHIITPYAIILLHTNHAILQISVTDDKQKLIFRGCFVLHQIMGLCWGVELPGSRHP